MKVVHINAMDSGGGAAIAARRHCEAMRRAGIDATMLVLCRKDKSCSFVKGVFEKTSLGKLRSFVSANLMNVLLKPFKPWAVFSYPMLTTRISSHPLVREADMIYLHWIAASMLSTREVERILQLGKPVRWYMHDMNPITGGCHYAMDCEKFKTGCRDCPFLHKFMGIDLAKRQFNLRMKHWMKYPNLEAYTPSYWLGNEVKQSALWQGHPVTVFPNVFDTKKFHPCDKKTARDILGFQSYRKVILFGAAGVDSEYKGWSYLRDALNMLDPEKYEALILGTISEKTRTDLKIKCHFTGFLHDEYSLVLAYNAADVFVSSSLADNYPNVVMEAMACGLPCVGFKIGGLKDQIKHRENGYLAEYKSSQSLAEGMRFVCEASDSEYEGLQKKARAFVCEVASYDAYKSFS